MLIRTVNLDPRGPGFAVGRVSGATIVILTAYWGVTPVAHESSEYSEYIVEARGLSKWFGGVAAVNDLDLKIRRGTIHALIGPNGAGKTTLFNLLTKALTPTSGQIFLNGHDITRERSAAIARRGMVRSFQISAVFTHMTVRENIRIALQQPSGVSFHFWKSASSLARLDDEVDRLIADVDLRGYEDEPAGQLPYGRKRALELATTLALDPEMLLLDEPTAGLGREDVDRIADLIGSVGARRTILMVEHNLSVVAKLSQSITVLTRGQKLAEGPYEVISRNPAVMSAYLGTADAE
jgi:branched-chain amino acid transport system ATP-binding protein